MKRNKRRSSEFRQDLPKVIAFFAALALLMASAGLTGYVHGKQRDYSVRARLLRDCNLSEDLVPSVTHYRYFSDVLFYHDGYELMQASVDPERWVTPADWAVGEASIWDVVNTHLHGTGISSALYYQIFDMDIPNPAREWFFLEYEKDGAPEFLLALYDGSEKLFLYRGHTLIGDPALRITGPES